MRGKDRYHPSNSTTLKRNCLTAVLFLPCYRYESRFLVSAPQRFYMSCAGNNKNAIEKKGEKTTVVTRLNLSI